jgi:hypothetical protein
VPPLDDQSVEMILNGLRNRDRQFQFWLYELRNSDPTFGQASILRPDDDGEWQAAVYLLTGSPRVWSVLGPEVLAERSLAPVVRELEDRARYFSSSELALLTSAAHLWNIYESEVQFPYAFDESHLRRWVDACLLRSRVPPEDQSRGGGA